MTTAAEDLAELGRLTARPSAPVRVVVPEPDDLDILTGQVKTSAAIDDDPPKAALNHAVRILTREIKACEPDAVGRLQRAMGRMCSALTAYGASMNDDWRE